MEITQSIPLPRQGHPEQWHRTSRWVWNVSGEGTLCPPWTALLPPSKEILPHIEVELLVVYFRLLLLILMLGTVKSLAPSSDIHLGDICMYWLDPLCIFSLKRFLPSALKFSAWSRAVTFLPCFQQSSKSNLHGAPGWREGSPLSVPWAVTVREEAQRGFSSQKPITCLKRA